jgi:hypothetical protein
MADKFPFGKHKGKLLEDIPDTYLDYLLGEKWFIENTRNKFWIQDIVKELDTRRRSRCYVEDDYGQTLEDI